MGEMAIQDRNARYRGNIDWKAVRDCWATRAADIPEDATMAGLGREKASHRGIGARRGLTRLLTAGVNQDFLDEICALERLEYLWLGWPVTAHDLSGLARLQRLRFLKIDSPRNVTDFGALADCPALASLFVENAKHMPGLDWLAPLGPRLAVLGIEGSMWTMQKVESLAPLAGFAMEALFLTSVQLRNKDLTPLARCPNLAWLSCARFAPKPRFEELKALRPDIECSWFDRYEI
ncbi:MAG: hypothetical protein KF780_02325 [Sphingomonas sp.]|nr:hypothetical protein [Sphingomonas sp.]